MQSEQTPRRLKIQAQGDPWAGRVKPQIRLLGRWLERAGFAPGGQVQIVRVGPGVLELRATPPPAAPAA